ncbi:MAG: hypothetical protein LBR80_09145 [Deltaproteobacteria bacterium]|nr:hypothetical protein [Deltaproteobacteria bacterium]
MSIQDLLKEIDDNLSVLKTESRLTPEIRSRIDNDCQVHNTYYSNSFEGNRFSLAETRIILEKWIKAGGKSLRDLFEEFGHEDAFDYMLKTTRESTLRIMRTPIADFFLSKTW